MPTYETEADRIAQREIMAMFLRLSSYRGEVEECERGFVSDFILRSHDETSWPFEVKDRSKRTKRSPPLGYMQKDSYLLDVAKIEGLFKLSRDRNYSSPILCVRFADYLAATVLRSKDAPYWGSKTVIDKRDGREVTCRLIPWDTWKSWRYVRSDISAA